MAAASTILAGAAAAATVAGGVATIAGGQGGSPNVKLELPPELEEAQLENFAEFLKEADANLKNDKKLADSIAGRIDALDEMAKQATPSAKSIQKLNAIDQDIASRFGKDVAADVQAGIITDEAKRQAKELQGQIAAELTAQGKNVDDALMQDIQQQIRARMNPASPENEAINEVRNALLNTVREEGDVLRRDPRVESELEKGKNKLISDLAARGIDPNSTAGRRALQDFNQSATETRFTTSEQLQTNKVARLSQLSQSVLSTTEASDVARSRALEQAVQTQVLASNRISRLQQLGQAIDSPVQSAILSGEIERSRRAENLQRSQVALSATRQQQEAFAGGISAQAQLQKLRTVPSDLRQRSLDTRRAASEEFRNFGTQKFSRNTKELLETAQIRPFSRTGSGVKVEPGMGSGMGATPPRRYINAPDGTRKYL